MLNASHHAAVESLTTTHNAAVESLTTTHNTVVTALTASRDDMQKSHNWLSKECWRC
jgi:hypothetical protein